MTMKLAFIGLGNMGLPMARNLVKANYEVYGVNRSKAKEDAFVNAGGKAGRSAAELAQDVDVLMTCLPMPADVEKVFLGDDGVIPNGRKGLILIDFSTVSPDLNRKIAASAEEAGMFFLDAPVSGGTVGAEQGTLSVMVGGEKAVFDQVLPILEVVGKNIYHVGATGSGNVVKLINQLMVGIHTQAASEAMVLGEAMGVSKETLHQILSASFAQSRIYDRHYTQFVQKNAFEPGFALNLLHKDMTLLESMAQESGTPIPLGSYAGTMLASAKAGGFGDKDMSSMYLYNKERASVKTERKYFAVFLPMKDAEKSQIYRPQHLAFLEEQRNAGRLFANGRFADGGGGLVVYIAQNEEEVKSWVEQDPYIVQGARSYEIHEWDLVKGHLF
ncbi:MULTISPECIES: NAD(P)-binding domain-containing protein [Paenibacillus]|uniref:2-hydroxy-3-oxopropionate reductase n=2 Tax=Paenibacillus naphthalenovorans TaxID=162209 RepID=A0A0U2M1D1_9BACL|nr:MULTISPECIES: NAD(P)-binding domain-containing protein [Paenibacillus]ALS20848.1 2-hydroxy-3-oxopropionate reductase [Paenibacillus naphthalenovorans]GCL70879.1 3-hydroxyisobutyrate dehydrogenase [Paenibacillus naphthalenovorans]